MNAEPPFKRGRKFDQVIAGARDVFMREGFEGASVDVIARDAGVSKATLYSYFPDKRALFRAVLQRECDLRQRTSMEFEICEQPVPEALERIAAELLTFFLSEDGLAVFRVCAAEAHRFPEIGRDFYETGPRTAMQQMAGYLSSSAAQAALDIDDPLVAADTFMQLLRGDLMLRRLMGMESIPDAQTVAAEARRAVRTFLARYGRPGAATKSVHMTSAST